jgi:hypothetical protein
VSNFFQARHGLDYEQGFMQGAGRILIADGDTAFPDAISDIIVTAAGPTVYDPTTDWTEVGFTKTGINITRNNAEETFTVDQLRSAIKTRPSNWEMSVGTQLAETSLETFALAWELPDPEEVTAAATGTKGLKKVGMGAPTSYSEKLLCVLFLYPDDIVRAFVWRRCLHAAQESGFTLQNTGEQVSLPWRLNCMADDTAPDGEQFGVIFEETPALP